MPETPKRNNIFAELDNLEKQLQVKGGFKDLLLINACDQIKAISASHGAEIFYTALMRFMEITDAFVDRNLQEATNAKNIAEMEMLLAIAKTFFYLEEELFFNVESVEVKHIRQKLSFFVRALSAKKSILASRADLQNKLTTLQEKAAYLTKRA